MKLPSPQTPRRIYIKPSRSAEQTLLMRLAALATLVTLVIAIFWFDREGLKDQTDGEISFGDVVYFSAVTISTVGYGDIIPVSPRARMMDALLVTPLRLVIWFIFLGTAYELVLQRWLEARRMSRIQHTLDQHLIICGYGHSGRSSAQEAVARGTPPEQVLVLDLDVQAVERAAEAGYVGLLGDSTREQDLVDAGIARAKAVLICVGRDDAAVLSVLTVRQLAPALRVICSVDEEENIKLIRQAGADALVAPSIVGGYLMADSVQSSHVADYISDLMCSDRRIRLVERPARADEIGIAMRDLGPGLVVRLYRGHIKIGFWEQSLAIVREGDLLLEIEHDAKAESSPA